MALLSVMNFFIWPFNWKTKLASDLNSVVINSFVASSLPALKVANQRLPYQRLFRTHRGLGSNPQCISLILCRFIGWWETLCAYLFPLSGVIWVPCWKLFDCFLVTRDPGLPRLVLCPVLKRKFGPLLLLLSHTGHTKLVQCTFDRMPNFGRDHSTNLALWKKERLSIYWLLES